MNLSHRSIIASMADGIGELSFAGEDWVARAKTEMDICSYCADGVSTSLAPRCTTHGTQIRRAQARHLEH